MRKNTVIILIIIFLARGLPWASAADSGKDYVEGEVIVTFKESSSLDDARKNLGKHAFKFAHHFAGLSEWRHRQTGLVRVKGRTTAELIAKLKSEPGVESVEPNYVRHFSGQPNDAQFGNQWGLQNTGQSVNGTAGTAGRDIKFVPAWSLARPSTSEVVVGLIETGVDYTHPDLAGDMWINPGEIPNNNLDDDGNGKVDDYYGYDFYDGNFDPSDPVGHGTGVAGIVAACGNNQLGIIGVGYQAKIMALKVDPDASTATTIQAIEYATMMKLRPVNSVNVVALNASYNGSGASSAESAAISAAGSAGIIFCTSAGNAGTNNDTSPTYPASYRLPNMIVVAASDQNDALWSSSSYGSTTVDLAAPGVNILSTAPGGNYQYLSGTSFANAHVTGAVAFAAANFPNETVAQRIQRILANADNTLTPQDKVIGNRRLNLQRILDTDNNGLPDWWENDYLGQPTGADPNGDFDHDGMTNLQEFLAGTNPADPQSALAVSSIAATADGTGFVVTWQSVPGKTYKLLYTDSFTGTWLQNLPNSEITANLGQTSLSYTDTGSGGRATRFYRVKLVIP